MASPKHDIPTTSSAEDLLFRYRARNYAETLSAAEQSRWRELVRRRLTDAAAGAPLTLAAFRAELDAARARPDLDVGRRAVLDALEAYGADVAAAAGLAWPPADVQMG